MAGGGGHPPATGPDRRQARLRLAGLVAVLGVATVAAFVLADRGSDASSSSDPGPSSTVAPTAGADPAATDLPDPMEAYRRPGWIAEENQQPGATDWRILDDTEVWRKIDAFADATSVDHGDPITVRVSTRAPTWTARAFRIGHYQGNGARLVWTSPEQPGVDQPPPVVDPETRMATAPWAASLTITPDATWPPGQYLLRLDSSDGGATFVPVAIRDDGSHAALLVQSAVTTWQAYNGWGGASLYTGDEGRADVVTFDRPYTGNGSGEFLGREAEMISLIEGLGLDVTYWTDTDLDQRGELAMNHRAIVIPGHDEYYTVRMRQNLEAARDAGVNLGFFGANNVFRRIRLEPSELGEGRHEVNYRSASRDPMAGIDPAQVTTSFRDAPAANPESSLTGTYYECNPVEDDWVVGDASAWMFEGSGFRDGDVIPDMVGNEYDRVTPGVPTPADIQVLAHSPVDCKGLQSYADTTWYAADSGAGVFSAATFGWEPLMDVPCPDGVLSGQACQLQKVTENLLRAFSEGPAGAAHPPRPNTTEFGIPPPS